MQIQGFSIWRKYFIDIFCKWICRFWWQNMHNFSEISYQPLDRGMSIAAASIRLPVSSGLSSTALHGVIKHLSWNIRQTDLQAEQLQRAESRCSMMGSPLVFDLLDWWEGLRVQQQKTTVLLFLPQSIQIRSGGLRLGVFRLMLARL